jgi:hypothetical protein
LLRELFICCAVEGIGLIAEPKAWTPEAPPLNEDPAPLASDAADFNESAKDLTSPLICFRLDDPLMSKL